MKISSLILENFRQHARTQLEFQSGLTGIIGPNGAGKSSIVEAVAFALYGSRAIRGKTEDLRTWGSSSAMRVVLTFEHGGDNFRIERTFAEAALYRGGELTPIARGARDVSLRVTALLHMSFEEFSATYFTEQKGLEFLSRLRGAAERERFVLRLLGYDRFERVQENIRTDKRDKAHEILGRQASVGNKDELLARLAAEGAELESVRARHQQARVELEQAESKTARLLKEMKHLELQVAALTEIKRSEDRVRAQMHEKEVRLEELEREENTRSVREKRLTEECVMTLAFLPEFSTIGGASAVEPLEVARIEQRMLAARERVLGELQDAETRLRVEHEARQARIAELTAAARQHEKQVRESETRARKLRSLEDEGRCPTCEQTLGEHFGRVLCSLNEEIAAHAKALEGLSAQLRADGQEPADTVQTRRVIEELRAQQQAITHAERQLMQCGHVREQAARIAAERARLGEELKALAGDRASLQEKAAPFDALQAEFRKAKGAHDAASGLEQVARLQRVRLEGEEEKARALVARTEEELRQYDSRRAELDAAMQEELVLAECDMALTEFRKEVVAHLRPRLAEYASEFLLELTDGRYATVEVGDDFSPTVVDNGEVKSVISGGEEDLLNLCMRLALSHLLAERAGHSFSFLILDEVFGSLDGQRRSNVLELLERLGERFEQIIIITHLDDIREGVRHLLALSYDESARQTTLAADSEDLAAASNL